MPRKRTKKQITTTKTTTMQQVVELAQLPYPCVYADYTNLSVSYTGFKFVFSNSIDKTEKRIVAAPQVSVSLSAEHALQIYRLMERQLKTFQEQYGPIRELPDTTPK